jgi:hypothetical protein
MKIDQILESSLNEFAPAGGGGNTPRGPRTPGRDPWGGDDSGEDPYSRPEPEYYSRSIDYFGQFEADHFDQEDMDDATGVFKGYWDYDGDMKQIAYFKFDDPEQTGSDDPGMGWYYEPQNESVAEAGKKKKKKSSRSQGYFFPGYSYYGLGNSGEGGGDGGGESINRGVAEGKPKEKEADYGADYQDMVARVKKLAGLGPLRTVYDPQKRVYKNVPTAVQPKKEQR